MMRRLIVAALILMSTSAFAGTELFHAEQEAQKHCPKDTVVWVNLKSGIYHWKGQVWYANTNAGAFVCKTEADANGMRPTRGQ
jgi:hypothetical protein